MKRKDNITLTKANVRAITEAYRYYHLLDDDCQSRIPASFVNFLDTYKDLGVGEPLHPALLEMQDISQEGWNLIAQMSIFIAGSEDTFWSRISSNKE